MRRRRWTTPLLALLAAPLLGPACARPMPTFDPARVDPTLLGRCTEGPGALVLADERYEDYWGRGYDSTKYELLGEEQGGAATGAPTTRMVVRRLALRIL